ncbi:MAG: polysaccharide pyruvyl transferase family protein [Prevotella sp.]|nr:polysaccharide pyruvyl transferase family protein [Prevotella sp.]
MKKLNIILGNAPINNGNRGCVALVYSALFLIDSVLTEKGVEYQFFLTDSMHPKDGDYHIQLNDKKIRYKQIGHVLPLSKKSFLKSIINYKKLFFDKQIFKDADYFLDIGQGDSFADIYGANRFNAIDLIHKEALRYRKPYCLLPQTIGPFKTDAIKKAANKAIEKATMVMARDKKSYDYVLTNVPEQINVKEYIDVAFFLPYTKQVFDPAFTHVGLNISGLLWHGGYTGDNQFGLKDDYQKIIREIIEYFIKMPNVKLHLISHVVGSERNIENDYEVCYDLIHELNYPNLILASLFLSPIDAKSYISGMDFFMGARMHSTIAAFSSGVPVVPMAYSRKFNGLFEDSLGYQHLIDLKTDNTNEVLASIIDTFSKRESLRNEIRELLWNVVEKKKKLIIDDLRSFFHEKK